MLLYNTDSWHYRLVLYIFTKEFFLEITGLDYEAMDSQYNTQTKQEKEFNFIYKKKPKTINFCPYCRAVVAAIACLPFVYLWRLYPHKPKPKKTHEEIMKSIHRRGLIARIIAGGFNMSFGIKNIVYGMDDGLFIVGIIQIIIGVAFVTAHLWGHKVVRWIILHSPKWERKHKPEKTKNAPKPSKLIQKIKSKHDVYCPPIFFIENTDEKKMR